MLSRPLRAPATGMLALIALLALACTDNEPAEPQPSPVESEETVVAEPVTPASGLCDPEADAVASCEVEGDANSLIAHVRGDWPGGPSEVVVEYGNPAAGYLRTAPAVAEDGAFEVPIGRLRAETAYEFRVLSTDGMQVGATGELTSGSLPHGLRRAEFDVVEGTPSNGLTFMDFNPNEHEDGPTFHGLIAIDGEGHVVWYLEAGETNALRQTPEGDLVFIDYTFGLRKVSPLGEELASLESECVPIVYHHEVEILPDGRVLTMGFDVRDTFDEPERLQVGDTIIVWDPETGESEVAWSIHDHEDTHTNRTASSDLTEGFMWTGCDEDLPTEDWSHSNAVKRTPEGDFIFSSRHLNQLHSVTSDFDGVNWRLGGVNSDFEFPDPGDQFYHQHSGYQLENGNVLLFDNGNTRPDEEGGEYSRALELELDFENGIARKVWEYVPEPAIFSPCCANVERLENGNTLMVFPGDTEADLCCRVHTIVEADADQRTVWKLDAKAPGLVVVYRVYPGATLLGEEDADPPQASRFEG